MKVKQIDRVETYRIKGNDSRGLIPTGVDRVTVGYDKHGNVDSVEFDMSMKGYNRIDDQAVACHAADVREVNSRKYTQKEMRKIAKRLRKLAKK